MQRIASVVVSAGLLCAILLGVCSAYAHGQDAALPRGGSLHLVGELLPTPPKQSAQWIAPKTELSGEFLSATDALFRQGLADPRGCEYHDIEVGVGGLGAAGFWGAIVKTHGWVIPDNGNQRQRFGICWNGLVYPLALVGQKADLRADALAAARAEPERFQQGGIWWNDVPPPFEDMCFCAPSEERSVSHESPLPIKACLLLRLGAPELAEGVWNHWMSKLRSHSSQTERVLSVEESIEPIKPVLKDPYLVLANFWTLSLCGRAVRAHMLGDDHLALASAVVLDRIWPKVVAEAEKRGFRKPAETKDHSNLWFLLDVGEARKLLADQQRRAKNQNLGLGPPVLLGEFPDPSEFTHALEKELGRFPDRSRRIALLVHELEEASSATATDQIVISFLSKEGGDAIEPLLKCLETDNRLSRSPQNGTRYPASVYGFAAAALYSIVKMPLRPPNVSNPQCDLQEDNRQSHLVRIRAYWERYKAVPPAERWYGVLADDQAQPYQWLAAARAIVQPTRVPVSLDSLAHGWGRDWWRLDPKREMHGEVLRNKTSPNVGELMVKRIQSLDVPYRVLLAKRKKLDEEIEKSDAQANKLLDGPQSEYDRVLRRQEELEQQRAELDQQISDDHLGWSASFLKGCDIAFCLAQWDSAAALTVLREQTALCRQAVADYGNSFKEYLARLLSVRADAGDRQAALGRQRPTIETAAPIEVDLDRRNIRYSTPTSPIAPVRLPLNVSQQDTRIVIFAKRNTHNLLT